MSKKTVFISYSRDDKPFVVKLVDSLRKQGLEVWFDVQLRSGQDWDDALESQIKSTNHMIIVLSETSVASDNVKNEMRFAMDHGKQIHPILYESCSVPLSMRRMHYIDFTTKGYDEGVNRLVQDIKEDIVKGTVESVTSKRGKSKSGSKKNLVYGLVAAITISVGVWQFWPKDNKIDFEEPIDTVVNTVEEEDKSTTEPEAILSSTKNYRSRFDYKSKIPVSLTEAEVWDLLTTKNEADEFDGYLWYLEHYGVESRYSEDANKNILDGLDKVGYVIYNNQNVATANFKSFLIVDMVNKTLVFGDFDHEPKPGDLAISMNNSFTPVYKGVLGRDEDHDPTGNHIKKDEIVFVMDNLVSSNNKKYLKVKYRNY